VRSLLVVLLLAAPAFATTRFDLAAGESRTIEMMGATAAWAIDTTIVDVAASNGKVTIFARAAGATKIVIISITGQNAFDVVVASRPGTAAKKTSQSNRATAGVAEVRYSSAAKEIQNSVAITREEKNRKTEIAARVVHHAAEPVGDRATTSVPAVSYRIFTRGREITFFDREVDHSPLTLSHTPVRGLHYLDDHWRIHAGYTAYAAYQSFLIPVERQTVAGAAYAFRATSRSTITPGVFAYRGEGNVLSLLYGYEEADRLSLRTELGYSNAIGGAVQLAFDARKDRVRADVRYRPTSFAVAAAGNPRGFFADASWSHEYGRGSNASMSLSASDTANARVIAATVDADHRVNDKLSLMSGVSFAKFANQKTLTVPLGARLDFARGGLGAIYRYSDRGHGLRLFGRASVGRMSFSAYADRQENAPTLEAIFAERPDLALALGELGISATSPSDIARALREHAILADLGFIEGVTIDLAPVRTQLGVEAAWLGVTESRQQLRARVLHNVIEGVSNRTATTIASLTYSRKLTASADVFASYSWWRTERRGEEARVQPVAEIGVRQHFDGLPSLFNGTGSISGVVFADENLDGQSDGAGIAAEIELDGLRTERTRADGTFTFDGVARGSHQLVARVPGKPEAYFTTPSRVEVETGEHVAFGVASVAARLLGRVTTDAGSGIAGVRVLLARGNAQVIATTDSEGAFTLAAAPGEWELSILTDSVPAGHSLAGTEARTVMLDRAQPQRTMFALRAHRSVSISGAQPHATIEVLGKTVRADEEGRASLRSLPAGEVIVVANGTQHRLTLPQGPSSLTVDLATKREAETVRTVVAGERNDSMRGYVVAVGAFRVRANANDAAERARAQGVSATVDTSGALAIVKAGPYESRQDANDAAARLTRAGLEAVVLSRN
jgi:hypothetical protein